MDKITIEDRIRLEEQFISQTKKMSELTEEEKQNFVILEDHIRKGILNRVYKDMKRFTKSLPEVIDLIGIEKVVELFEPIYGWETEYLLKDQHLCLNLLENSQILFNACKGWYGGADNISEIPDLEESHDVFQNEDKRLFTNPNYKSNESHNIFHLLFKI